VENIVGNVGGGDLGDAGVPCFGGGSWVIESDVVEHLIIGGFPDSARWATEAGVVHHEVDRSR